MAKAKRKSLVDMLNEFGHATGDFKTDKDKLKQYLKKSYQSKISESLIRHFNDIYSSTVDNAVATFGEDFDRNISKKDEAGLKTVFSQYMEHFLKGIMPDSVGDISKKGYNPEDKFDALAKLYDEVVGAGRIHGVEGIKDFVDDVLKKKNYTLGNLMDKIAALTRNNAREGGHMEYVRGHLRGQVFNKYMAAHKADKRIHRDLLADIAKDAKKMGYDPLAPDKETGFLLMSDHEIVSYFEGQHHGDNSVKTQQYETLGFEQPRKKPEKKAKSGG